MFGNADEFSTYAFWIMLQEEIEQRLSRTYSREKLSTEIDKGVTKAYGRIQRFQKREQLPHLYNNAWKFLELSQSFHEEDIRIIKSFETLGMAQCLKDERNLEDS